MYLKRHIDAFLRNWKNDPGHLPLIVKGARQVGKTESIRHFAESAYESVVEINFVRDRKFLNITESGYDAASVVRAISRIEPSFSFAPGKTLLFFDEIQANPDIATTLKFFKLDGRFDVICSGSLLGVSYKRIESNSVGYKTDFEMFSMDFEEFLWACGYEDDFVEHIFSHMASSEPFPPSFNEMMFDRFLDYVILGGMPSVVKAYFETGNFSGTLAMQRQIIEDYKEDISKSTEGSDGTRMLNVLRHVPVQLEERNRKFQITKISPGARYRDYRGCIDALERAGVASVCRCLAAPSQPLAGNFDERKFKLYFRDTGLLVATLGDEVQQELRANKNLGTYDGAVLENAVSEALAKQGMPLFYYKRENSTLGMDFFGRTVNDLVPIEVNAGNPRAKALGTMIESCAYEDIRWGIRLWRGNIGFENSIYSFPCYCSFLLKRFLELKRN